MNWLRLDENPGNYTNCLEIVVITSRLHWRLEISGAGPSRHFMQSVACGV